MRFCREAIADCETLNTLHNQLQGTLAALDLGVASCSKHDRVYLQKKYQIRPLVCQDPKFNVACSIVCTV